MLYNKQKTKKGETMDKFVNALLETHLGNIIDKSRDELIMNDETCKQDEADLNELESRYMSLNLARADRLLINDYIACMQSVDHRNADLSYMAGVRDTVKLLHSLDVLKGIEEQEK